MASFFLNTQVDMNSSLLSKNKEVVLFFLVIVLCIALYWPGLSGIFTLDDETNIKLTQVESLSISNLANVVNHNQSGIHPLSRAVPSISFSLSYFYHGFDAWWFKLHNLMLHILCGILVFLFTQKVSSLYDDSKNKANSIALITASIWLLHPLHLSTTLYAVQRITQFSTLFTLAALYSYTLTKTIESKRVKIILLFLAYPTFFTLGMMSKENAALLCAYILVIEISVRGKSLYRFGDTLNNVFVYTFSVIPLLFGGLLFMFKFHKFTDYTDQSFTLVERGLSQIHIVTGYLGNLIFPRLSTMGLYLDDTPIQKHLDIATSFKGGLLLCLFTLSIYLVFKRKFLGLFIIFFIGHLIESSIIPLELAFEHRNYFPSIGVFIAIAWGITQIPSNKLQVAALVLIFALLATLLNIRSNYWSNEFEWQKTTMAFHPKSLRTHVAYKNFLDKYQGLEAGRTHIKNAKKILPNEPVLPLFEMVYLCLGNEDNKLYSRQLIDKIDEQLKRLPLTTMRISAIMQLSTRIEKVRCKTIDTDRLYSFVHNLITRREHANLPVGHLYGVRGTLLYSANRFEDASDNYRLAYFTTLKVGYITSAISALASNRETYPSAIKLAKEVNNGKYFNVSLNKAATNKINSLIKESPYRN